MYCTYGRIPSGSFYDTQPKLQGDYIGTIGIRVRRTVQAYEETYREKEGDGGVECGALLFPRAASPQVPLRNTHHLSILNPPYPHTHTHTHTQMDPFTPYIP